MNLLCPSCKQVAPQSFLEQASNLNAGNRSLMKQGGAVGALVFVCFFALASATQYDTRIVDTTSGQIEGIIYGNGVQFLGIPYAEPPIGDLRWKAPVLKNRSESILSASSYGPMCMQTVHQWSGDTNLSEDCLYLNVFLPGTGTGSHLPVRVWIHGGGFLMGSSNEYPSAQLALASNSVIVTINYRVGLFGFLVLPELIQENAILNYGLQDQQKALEWVQLNIASFGGDPGNVMIFGESAGGMSVAMHLLMKQSWNLYHKAVLESTAPWVVPSLESATQLGRDFVSLISSCNQSATKDLLTCMRNISADLLLTLWAGPPQLLAGTIPCVDRQQLMDTPAKLFVAGKMNPRPPLIVGKNYGEGNLFAFLFSNSVEEITEEKYMALLAEAVPSSYISDVVAWYAPIVAKKGYWHALSKIYGDLFIYSGTALILEGAVKAHNPAVWHYVFAQRTTHSDFAFLNVSHGSELPYVFANPAVFFANNFTAEEQAVSKQIVSYWTNFHRTSNPNDASSPRWPEYHLQHEGILLAKGYGTAFEWNRSNNDFWRPIIQQPS